MTRLEFLAEIDRRVSNVMLACAAIVVGIGVVIVLWPFVTDLLSVLSRPFRRK